MANKGKKVISLAQDFSRHPGPRFVNQGPHSGERFRRVLVKALSEYERIVVDLDGTTGIGSSFLDEAFGGLIFAEGMSKQEVERRVEIKSIIDSSYKITVSDALRLAEPMQKRTPSSAHTR